MKTFETTTFVPAPVEDVFAFFSDAHNLERITPPSLKFQIVTPGPIVVRDGAVIDYRLRLHGVPMRWQSEIRDFVPGERFTDVQLKGPYRTWIHLHTFEPAEGGTLMRDVVQYDVGFGILGEWIDRLFVARSVQEIFRHRGEVIVAAFQGSPSLQKEPGDLRFETDV